MKIVANGDQLVMWFFFKKKKKISYVVWLSFVEKINPILFSL